MSPSSAADSVCRASAVILPEAEEVTDSTLRPPKRRQSSTGSNDSKRPRLDHIQSDANTSTAREPPPSVPDSKTERRRSGAVEERKRGQRLFGALLGTLSQSSSGASTQRRRVDIEKKQQAKLKQQAEDYDEQKRKKRDEILARRRDEQKVYDKQSVRSPWLARVGVMVADRQTDEPAPFESSCHGRLFEDEG